MGQPVKKTREEPQRGSTNDQSNAIKDHAHDSGQCLRCQVLEARIAELESRAAERVVEFPTFSPEKSKALPKLDFKALRLIPHGWGEGWQLRPSPARRHWMDELPHAYKCLPLVVANQWGWQLLCPTDVVATWDGSAGLEGLRVECSSTV